MPHASNGPDEASPDPVLRAIGALAESAVARPIAYRISVALDGDTLDLSGEAQVTVEMTERSRRLPLLLNPGLRLLAARAGGAAVKAERSSDLLWLDLGAAAPAGRRLVLELRYQGELPGEYVVREGEARWIELHCAAFWYPVVNWKWDLSQLSAFAVECRLPETMVAIANIDAPGDSPSHGCWQWHSKTETAAVAILAGPYVTHTRREATRRVRCYARPDMSNQAAALSEEADRIVSCYAACFGAFSLPVLDVVIPPQSVGGNWGLDSMIVTAQMEPGDPARNFAILTHEIGHQWWGRSVQFNFQTDLWLVEGLTEFSGLRARLMMKGEEAARDHMASWTRPRYEQARETRLGLVDCRHESPHSGAIREDGSAVFLTQLRLHLGPADFDRRLRRFYQEHINTTATAADFARAMLTGAPAGTEAFFRAWTTQPLPEVSGEQVLAGLR